MSRKFIDDHIQVLGGRAGLPGPSSDNRTFDPGHQYRDQVDGTIFHNEGNLRDMSIFRKRMVNSTDLVELFTRKPGLNADIANVAEAVRMIANPDFEVLGTNMTSALSTFAAGGGITLTTAGADGDAAILTPHLDTNQTSWAATKWNTSDQILFETNIKTGASVTNTIIWAGFKLTNTNVVATDNDQVYVRFEDDIASGVLQLVTSASGVDTTTNLDLTIAASTSYHLKIVVDADRNVALYVNGVQLARHAAALTANIDLIPYIAVEADGAAAAKAITVRGLRCAKDQND